MLDRRRLSRVLLVPVILVGLVLIGCGDGQSGQTPVVTGSPVFPSGTQVDLPAQAVGADTASVVRIDLEPLTIQNISALVQTFNAEMPAEQRQQMAMIAGMFGGMVANMSQSLQDAGAQSLMVTLVPGEGEQARGAAMLQIKPGADVNAVKQAMASLPPMMRANQELTLQEIGEQYLLVQTDKATMPDTVDADRRSRLNQALSMTEGGVVRMGFVMTPEARHDLQKQFEEGQGDSPQTRAMLEALQPMQFGGITLGIEGQPTLSGLIAFTDAGEAEQFMSAWQEMLAALSEQGPGEPAALQEQMDAAIEAVQLQRDGGIVSVKLDTEQLRALVVLAGTQARMSQSRR